MVSFALPNAIFETFPEVPCRLPILSGYFSHCSREIDLQGSWKLAITPDFVTLARLQSRLEYVMDDSTSISLVAVDVKDSEMALRDLGTAIKHSSIPSKDILERSLNQFVDDAKVTSGSLQQFGSRVWGAVDRVVSLNQRATIALERTVIGKSPELGGRSFADVASSLVHVGWGRITGSHQKGIEDLWLQALDIMEATLQKLIYEAQTNVGSLQILKERPDNIEDLVAQEKHGIQVAEQALKRKWLKQGLGLNQKKLQEHGASLSLLQMIHDDRNRALKHVAGVLFKLEQLSKDVENLREGVATPLILENSLNIPIEAHIKSIQDETERLINGQIRMRQIEDAYRREKFSV